MRRERREPRLKMPARMVIAALLVALFFWATFDEFVRLWAS